MLFRYLEISSFYNSMDGLLRAKFAFPTTQFRYAIAPTASLPSASNPMSMDASQIQQILTQGQTDAVNAVKAGEGASLENLIHYHSLKKSGDDRVKGLTLGEFIEAKLSGVFEEYNVESDPAFIKYKLMMASA